MGGRGGLARGVRWRGARFSPVGLVEYPRPVSPSPHGAVGASTQIRAGPYGTHVAGRGRRGRIRLADFEVVEIRIVQVIPHLFGSERALRRGAAEPRPVVVVGSGVAKGHPRVAVVDDLVIPQVCLFLDIDRLLP